MKTELNRIRLALEEHLSAINDNTTEIQALFDYLQELEIKVEKLSQRLEGVQLNEKEIISKPCSLNHTEKKVFLVLYTEETQLTYAEIAIRCNLPVSLIPDCISSLVQKSIPLHRSFVNDQLFWKLDHLFKERQAKENLINLSLQSFIK